MGGVHAAGRVRRIFSRVARFRVDAVAGDPEHFESGVNSYGGCHRGEVGTWGAWGRRRKGEAWGSRGVAGWGLANG